MSVGLVEKLFSVVPGRLPVGGATGNRPVGMVCWELSLGVAGVGGRKKLPVGEVPPQRPDRTPPVSPPPSALYWRCLTWCPMVGGTSLVSSRVVVGGFGAESSSLEGWSRC